MKTRIITVMQIHRTLVENIYYKLLYQIYNKNKFYNITESDIIESDFTLWDHPQIRQNPQLTKAPIRTEKLN